MIAITALILTFNERENIERTILALSWVPHILLVDSFSTDDTLALAVKLRPDTQVRQRAFDSFAGQCNYGLSQVESDWVLSIDADYEVSAKLAAEIRLLQPSSQVNGYRAGFVYSVFGRPLRNTLYPPRTVLYRKECATYFDEGHGHRVKVSGKMEPLRGTIIHDDRKPLGRWLVSQSRYIEVEARHLLRTPNGELSRQDRLRKRIFFAGPVMFVFLLFGRGLILDGWPGWFYVCQRVLAELLLSLRLLVERHHLEPGSDIPGSLRAGQP